MVPQWLEKMIQEAEDAGEYVPPGVYLVGFQEPTEAEREFGRGLEQYAVAVLAGKVPCRARDWDWEGDA